MRIQRPSSGTILLSYFLFIIALSLLRNYKIMIISAFCINLFSLIVPGVKYKSLFVRYILILPLFTLFVGLFSIFNVVTRGAPVFQITRNFYITDNGLNALFNLYFRVLAISSLSGLYIMNTGEGNFLRALKSIRVPDEVILIFSLTLRYIKIFLKDFYDFYIARKLRLLNRHGTLWELRWTSSRAFLLFKKGLKESIDLNRGLELRGALGAVRYPSVEGFKKIDFIYIIGVIIVISGILLIDRGL